MSYVYADAFDYEGVIGRALERAARESERNKAWEERKAESARANRAEEAARLLIDEIADLGAPSGNSNVATAVRARIEREAAYVESRFRGLEQELDEAVRERDGAFEAATVATEERDEAVAQRDRLREELDALERERDAALTTATIATKERDTAVALRELQRAERARDLMYEDLHAARRSRDAESTRASKLERAVIDLVLRGVE